MITRPLLMRVHKWCGLSACLLIFIQAATGVINVFGHDLARTLDSSETTRRTNGTNLPLSEVVRSLRDAHTELTLWRLEFPEEESGTYLAHLRSAAGDTVYASIDPETAEILRSGSIWSFPLEATKRIHYNYIVGLPGLLVVTLTGLLALLMAVTGLASWWPRGGIIKKRLGINWRAPGRLLLRQVHRSVGAVTFLLINFSLVTGLILAIDYVASDVRKTADAHAGAIPRFDFNIDAAVQIARTRYPDNAIRDIRTAAGERISIFFREPEHSPLAVSRVEVDPRNTTIVATLDAGSNTALWTTWLPLHTGKSFGVVGKTLVSANALVMIALALSGPFMWFTRVHSRRTTNDSQSKRGQNQ